MRGVKSSVSGGFAKYYFAFFTDVVLYSIKCIFTIVFNEIIMKRILIYLSIGLLVVFQFGILVGQEYSVMSYNIRYDNLHDKNNSWENRKDGIVNLLNYYHPDLFGIQEGLYYQLQFIDKNLVDYSFVGVGRENGDKNGEFSAVFYDTTKFSLVTTSTFWLSETSDTVSVGWDAMLERICTYGLFENLKTKNRIWVFNTHFDHIGEKAREKSAELILSKTDELNSTDLPVIVMGDLNSYPDSKPIQIFKSRLSDALEISVKPIYGPTGTFNGFNSNEMVESRIDYVFTSKLSVLSCIHIDDRLNNNSFVSDHLPVFVTVEDTINNFDNSSKIDYLNFTDKDDKLTGGVKMIPISTPVGDFNVWTKRIGNNPKIKVLLLHGGPGANHMYLESFDSYFPKEGVEYYYYDQLGSNYSDQPTDTSLWNIDRFVEEVEQVRKALNLDSNNFYLYGQSWGGILAIEYALKYQSNLKGLIISNMMSSIPDYVTYANDILGPQLDTEVLRKIKEFETNNDFSNPQYLKLIETYYYPEHVLRMPLESWPEPVNRSFSKLVGQIYVTMQGPSEFGVVGDAKLKNWDRSSYLKNISIPTLTIGAEYDTMDPRHMKWMANEVKQGRYLYCPKGSHLTMYDDPEVYFDGLIKFLKDVDNGNFYKE